MRQRLEKWMPWIGISGVTALGLGVSLAFADAAGGLPGQPRLVNETTAVDAASPMGAYPEALGWSLALQPPEQRSDSLKAIAAQPVSEEQVRARYLLAKDLIEQGQGGAAIDRKSVV